MEKIHHQVRRAQRQLYWDRLVHDTVWATLVATSCALIAVLAPKIWALNVSGPAWSWGWIGGSIVLGLMIGPVLAFARRPPTLAAALEVDMRFGLKERVSSACALSEDERSSDAGRALIEDAERRVDRIEIREAFRPSWGWRPLLPATTALLAAALALFLPDAPRSSANVPAHRHADSQQQVRKSLEELKKRLAERKKQAAEQGLEEAQAVFSKFQRAVDELSSKNVDRKKALIKLNNLTKQLTDRKQQLNAANELRKQLRQLPSLQQGPADRFASAVKNGDLRKALDAIKDLSEKLRREGLSEQEKKQLQKQLEQLKNAVDQMMSAKNELQNKQQQLQKQIDALKKQGKLAEAGELQQKMAQLKKQLDSMSDDNPSMGRLSELSQQLSQAAQNLKNGQSKEAADQMQKMAQSLQKAKQELDQLQSMDQMMQEIADSRNAMNCDKCNGAGCDECQSGGTMGQQAQQGVLTGMPGRGMNGGQGVGDRPEEETQTGGYRTRVGAQPKQGEAVRVGDAAGPNVAGNSKEAAKADVLGEYSQDPSPVIQQSLPRRERDQTKEYFELLRKGG